MKYRTFLIVVSTLAMAACAPSHFRLEDSYGDSIRNMIHNQIADPAAAANPDTEPLLGFDGSKGERVIQKHTENTSEADETVANEITLNIGK